VAARALGPHELTRPCDATALDFGVRSTTAAAFTRPVNVTNTGSASVSGYSIAPDGSLALLTPGGITGVTGGGPIDMALSRDSHDLYTLDGAAHGLSSFRVQADGSLVAQPGAGGLPAGTVGLAAR